MSIREITPETSRPPAMDFSSAFFSVFSANEKADIAAIAIKIEKKRNNFIFNYLQALL